MTTPIASLPSAGGARPRNLLATGTAFVAAGVTMFFGALAGAYVLLRSVVDEWPPKEAHLDQYLGNLLVITVLLGAVTAEWAVSAVRRDERRQATAAFAITVGLGIAFLNLLWYTAGRQGYGPGTHTYGTVVTAMAVGVAVLVALASALCALTAVRVRAAQVSAAEPDQARATAWSWHLATVATVVVWYVVVVLK